MSFITLILVSSLLSATVTCVPWPGPQATMEIATANWSPRPTGPAVGEADIEMLFARQNIVGSTICGWQGQGTNFAAASQAATCAGSSYCAFYTDVSVVACCSNGGNCLNGGTEGQLYTSCVKTKESTTNTFILSCLGTGSNCYRNSFENGYSQWGCNPTATQGVAVLTYGGATVSPLLTGGLAAALSSTQRTSTTAPPTTSTTATSTSTTSSSTSTSVTSVTSLTGSQSSPSPTPTVTTVPSPGLSTAAKAGIGAGGGIVVLALIGALFFYAKRKRSRKSGTDNYSGQGNEFHQSTIPPAVVEKHNYPTTTTTPAAEMEAQYAKSPRPPSYMSNGPTSPAMTTVSAMSTENLNPTKAGERQGTPYMGWQSGPIEELEGDEFHAHEMDGTSTGRSRYEMDGRGAGS